ncbi:TfoX/Sxy family DNA transformation protein [Amaricoccus sp.]|uniref:TfoX/Sxy family DNA transformation protein n=1 Tax=Amaricoccus sp. TaxID=1872485 RepID=UPI001B482627|nr:TfoX/Sxy family DNA transformation protein [Amaricoccus sp.]MBP7241960.1 TfoX/Sxy family DNA transformation protein [Amaricoccus sp.]
MSPPPSALRNLGPAADKAFARAGIRTAEDLIALGADEAYARVLAATGSRPHFAFFWAIAFAIQDRPWTSLGPEEKATMRVRFDAVRARAARPEHPEPDARARLEAALDRLGVGQPTISRPEKK